MTDQTNPRGLHPCVPRLYQTEGRNMANQLYAKRDSASIEPHYSRHLVALAEGHLMDREAIAAELAHRDQQIEELAAHLEYFKQIYRQWNGFHIDDDEFLAAIPRLVALMPTRMEASAGAITNKRR